MAGKETYEELRLWLWEYTDEHGKRRRSAWHMTEEQAKPYRDAVKVEGSLEVAPRLSAYSLKSVIAPAANGVILGFGTSSYILGLEAMLHILSGNQTRKSLL